jgi:hypothetical protein
MEFNMTSSFHGIVVNEIQDKLISIDLMVGHHYYDYHDSNNFKPYNSSSLLYRRINK